MKMYSSDDIDDDNDNDHGNDDDYNDDSPNVLSQLPLFSHLFSLYHFFFIYERRRDECQQCPAVIHEPLCCITHLSLDAIFEQLEFFLTQTTLYALSRLVELCLDDTCRIDPACF